MKNPLPLFVLLLLAACHKAPDGPRCIGGMLVSLITLEGKIVMVGLK